MQEAEPMTSAKFNPQKIQELSKTYRISLLHEPDIPAVLKLCSRNPQYYEHCPPYVSPESIRQDMQAVPEGKSPEDKYYLGFFKAGRLIAVMDLISGYPDQETAFIGFFMMNMDMQGQGAGSHIIEEVCACLNKYFSYIRLGYVKSNEQSRHFWQKNGFMPTGIVTKTAAYDIVVMQKNLRR